MPDGLQILPHLALALQQSMYAHTPLTYTTDTHARAHIPHTPHTTHTTTHTAHIHLWTAAVPAHQPIHPLNYQHPPPVDPGFAIGTVLAPSCTKSR